MAKHFLNMFIVFDFLILPIINYYLLCKLLKNTKNEEEGN